MLKRFWLGLLIVPLVILGIQHHEDTDNLTSAEVFNTGPYPADGISHRLTWTNTTGRRMLIRKSYLWIGINCDGLADSDAQIVRVSDGAIVARLQWDHYADPVAPVFKDDSFLPYYMALAPGDSLQLTYFTTPLSGTQTAAQAIAIIWWNY